MKERLRSAVRIKDVVSHKTCRFNGLRVADSKSDDHALKGGEHLADYIRRLDVPGSQFAFALRGQQVRYLAEIGRAHV